MAARGTRLRPIPFTLSTVPTELTGGVLQEVVMKSTIGAGAAATIALVFAGILTSSVCAQTAPMQSRYMSPRASQLPARASGGTPDPAVTRRCDDLPGLVTRLAKSECERRDTVNDDAPAGMTPAMREKRERLRAQGAAGFTDP